MVTTINTEDAVVLKFGGGIHSRASEDEIDPRECSDGQNFILDLENTEFKNRPPFDLLGTTPNASAVRGFIQLVKSDGTRGFGVQAGDTVYSWNGTSFSSIATVSASANLRGRIEHNFLLDDKVLITDLSLQQVVMEWDGTTFQAIPHNLGGSFFAKYCFVDNERAYFGNVISGTATPHLLVGSKRSDFTNLSVSDRPSSALAEDDPFFLLTLDLRPINGLQSAFRNVVISSSDTKSGNIYILTGESSKDFAVSELYSFSGAFGDESVRYVGNDIVYGRQGRIESIADTQRFGDVETDDLTVTISNKVASFAGWTTVFNSRVQRTYFFPEGENELWVFQNALRGAETGRTGQIGSGLSPWTKWTTNHSLQFQPTATMNMFDPVDGLEYVFMGDGSGNLYRLEGTGTSGDGGSQTIVTERLSKLFSVPLDAEAYNIEGWVSYRKNVAATLTGTFEFAGESVFNESFTVEIPAISGAPVFGGDVWFGGDFYFGAAFAGKFTRQNYTLAGQSNSFQLRLTIDSANDFQINEVGVRLNAASS